VCHHKYRNGADRNGRMARQPHVVMLEALSLVEAVAGTGLLAS
jgi:hypothetical protein